jgi:hypothetical protein
MENPERNGRALAGTKRRSIDAPRQDPVWCGSRRYPAMALPMYVLCTSRQEGCLRGGAGIRVQVGLDTQRCCPTCGVGAVLNVSSWCRPGTAFGFLHRFCVPANVVGVRQFSWIECGEKSVLRSHLLGFGLDGDPNRGGDPGELGQPLGSATRDATVVALGGRRADGFAASIAVVSARPAASGRDLSYCVQRQAGARRGLRGHGADRVSARGPGSC